ncbi:MAG: hypothetical protein JNL12_02415 [Planctomycetes bacterium]|nr:hypothetical protein [Planctomycetota bacterium]
MSKRLVVVLVGALAFVGCGGESGGPTVAVPDHPGATKSLATDRAQRRLYDGAPPVIPHRDFAADCLSCHTQAGRSVPDVGFAPANPHGERMPAGSMMRCVQCHVYAMATSEFCDNAFRGLEQDLRAGRRLNDLSPPVIPHQVLLRENCVACHTGPGAREEIRTPHPERSRCTQCHVEQRVTSEFDR